MCQTVAHQDPPCTTVLLPVEVALRILSRTEIGKHFMALHRVIQNYRRTPEMSPMSVGSKAFAGIRLDVPLA